MKKSTLILFFTLLIISLIIDNLGIAQNMPLTICSWNVKRLGSSKTEVQLELMASQIHHADLIALQEVVIGDDGKKALNKLIYYLKTYSNTDWQYILSDVTTSDIAQEKERYAYIWKKNKIKLIGKPNLDNLWQDSITREPFIATFNSYNTTFTCINFHAVPKTKNPEKEIAFFKKYPMRFANYKIIIMGDFNVEYNNNVFNPLKKLGYEPQLIDKKTTLRHKCINADCLAKGYDNFILNSTQFHTQKTEVIHFYKLLENILSAQKITDHCPISITISL
jgi:deoxyribonuclease-1-like protein